MENHICGYAVFMFNQWVVRVSVTARGRFFFEIHGKLELEMEFDGMQNYKLLVSRLEINGSRHSKTFYWTYAELSH